jgi:hypothetical protein
VTPWPAGEQEAAPESLAEPEAHQVAECGREPRDQEHRAEVCVALGGDDAAEHDCGLAGGDESDEGSGLEEGQAGDEGVGPGAERVGEVGERGLEVRRLHEARGGGDERRGGKGGGGQPGPAR